MNVIDEYISFDAKRHQQIMENRRTTLLWIVSIMMVGASIFKVVEAYYSVFK